MKNPTFDCNDESSLINGLKQEDSDAYSCLYLRFSDFVINWVVSRNGNKQDGENIFQEGIIVLLRKFRTDKFNPKYEVGKFFKGICIRMWEKTLERREKRRAKVREHYYGILQSTFTTDNPLNRIYIKCYSNLKTDCQEIIALTEYGRWSYKDLASKYSKSTPASLKNRKSQCIKMLKTKVDKAMGIHADNFILYPSDIELIERYMHQQATKAQILKVEKKLSSSLNFNLEYRFMMNVVHAVNIVEQERIRENIKTVMQSMKRSKLKFAKEEKSRMAEKQEINATQMKDNKVYVSVDDLMFKIEIEKAIQEYENTGMGEAYDQIYADLDVINRDTVSGRFDL